MLRIISSASRFKAAPFAVEYLITQGKNSVHEGTLSSCLAFSTRAFSTPAVFGFPELVLGEGSGCVPLPGLLSAFERNCLAGGMGGLDELLCGRPEMKVDDCC